MKRQVDGQLHLIPLHSVEAVPAHAKLEPTTPAPAELEPKQVFVTKRDRTTEPFNKARIVLAIESAFKAVRDIPVDESLNPAMSQIVGGLAEKIARNVLSRAAEGAVLDVESIQDCVENQLMCDGFLTEARRFILYREDRRKVREQKAHAEQTVPAAVAPAPEPAPAVAPVEDKVSTASLLKVIYSEAIFDSVAGGDFAAKHRRNFSYAIQDAVHDNQLAQQLLVFDFDHLTHALLLERDELIGREGLEWLYGNCLARERDRCIETPQYFWMRLSMALAANESGDKEGRALEFYEILSTLRFLPSEKLLRTIGCSTAVKGRQLADVAHVECASGIAGHINLAAHMQNGVLDELLLYGTVSSSVRWLDDAIDSCCQGADRSACCALEERSIGLGIVGFEKSLQLAGIAPEGADADAFVERAVEAVAYYATLASALLASERGSYPAYDDSNWTLGVLPFDALKLYQAAGGGSPVSCSKDWLSVRAAVRQHGMRNSHLLALMPSHVAEKLTGDVDSASSFSTRLTRIARCRKWIDGPVWMTLRPGQADADVEQARALAQQAGVRLFTAPVRVTLSEPFVDAAAASKVLKGIEKAA